MQKIWFWTLHVPLISFWAENIYLQGILKSWNTKVRHHTLVAYAIKFVSLGPQSVSWNETSQRCKTLCNLWAVPTGQCVMTLILLGLQLLNFVNKEKPKQSEISKLLVASMVVELKNELSSSEKQQPLHINLRRASWWVQCHLSW